MSPQLLSSRTVTARKRHQCMSCPTTAIQPGARYRRDRYVYDGRVYGWVQCTACDAIGNLVYRWWHNPDEGVGADEYAEWAQEHTSHPEHGEAARAYIRRLYSGNPDDHHCRCHAAPPCSHCTDCGCDVDGGQR